MHSILRASHKCFFRSSIDQSHVTVVDHQLLCIRHNKVVGRTRNKQGFLTTVYSRINAFLRFRSHHPADGQSEILFSKLPRLNQCIALNGVLLLPRPPTIKMNYSYTRLNSARGSDCLEVSQKYTGPDYNSAHGVDVAVKTLVGV